MKTISINRCKEICAIWYDGLNSALYQFASSGVYMAENHLRYLKELQECREPEYYLYPGTISKRNDNELKSCIRFFEAKGIENNINTIWNNHPVYGYKIPYIKEVNSVVLPLTILI